MREQAAMNFCVVFHSSDEDEAARCVAKVDEFLVKYNEMSELPYKVGCSCGFVTVPCGKVLTMEDYFCNPEYNKRIDNIYDLVNGKLSRNGKLRFKDSKKDIHVDHIQQRKDMNGRYVILSYDYIYLGSDACEIDIVKKFGAQKQETKSNLSTNNSELKPGMLCSNNN